MREVSVTCTVGEGNERHNHDLDYRETLEHVHGRPDGVIELIPYRDYREQINELMRPFIDEYNDGAEKRYQAAWARYKAGEIKSKPKRRDYPLMGYDYYNDHINDTYYDQHAGVNKPLPIWRELLIGLGDQADRKNGTITEEEAKRILRRFVEEFPERFPHFRLLGASLHLDEQGFYHAHIDYKPMFRVDAERGLNVSISQEAALEAMGFEPEQALVNGSDKAPLRFNAFRGRCYDMIEAGLRAEGIYLMYGATAKKDPGKDATTHQTLDDFKARKELKNRQWEKAKAAAMDVKHQSNIVEDIVKTGEPSPENLKVALEAGAQIKQICDDIEGSPIDEERGGRVVTFRLFDQLRSFIGGVSETIGTLCAYLKASLAKIRAQDDEYNQLVADYKELAREHGDLEVKFGDLADQYDALVDDYNGLVDENEMLRGQLAKRRSLSDTIDISRRALDDASKGRDR